MATALTPRQVTRAGLSFRAADLVAEDGTGNTFINDGNMWIVVRNDGSATDVVVTFVTTKTIDGLALSDRSTTAMLANDFRIFAPMDVDTYGSTVTITWAGTLTDVTVGVFYR